MSNSSLLDGNRLIDETTKKIQFIRDNMKKAQDRQKKFADRKSREVEFQEGDMVYLKVTELKGNIVLEKLGSLR